MRSKPALTSADVKKLIAACEAEAAKNKPGGAGFRGDGRVGHGLIHWTNRKLGS